MTTVQQAERLILAEARDFGSEIVSFDKSLGRVLAEEIRADRDLPPFNRVAMDGIAVSYQAIESGVTTFKIKAIQAAGDQPISIDHPDQCIEIMTGAALPAAVDTIIPYESIEIKDGNATLVKMGVAKGQSLHLQGADKKQGEVIIPAGRTIAPSLINTITSVGKSSLLVKKLPKVVVISSGDELVDIDREPSPIQIRKSNSYTIQAVLSRYGIEAELLHIPDDPQVTREKIGYCINNYDVILMTGGISMGKFDYIPKALEEMQVQTIFHKVSQRPGKPFWFGKHGSGSLVFAFPGNPVATFMCLHRYFLPWLQASQGLKEKSPAHAILDRNFAFKPELTYFLQVKLQLSNEGKLLATPVEGNGSGDFANLADTEAFIELPLERSEFNSGEAFKIWPFNN
jgi:molybdopterin molybdotransferase